MVLADVRRENAEAAADVLANAAYETAIDHDDITAFDSRRRVSPTQASPETI